MTCSQPTCAIEYGEEGAKGRVSASFDRPPSYLALLKRIEQEPTTLKLEQVNHHIKVGKEYVLQDNWTRIVGDEGAIKLAVSVIARSISFAVLLISPSQHMLLKSASSLFEANLLRKDMQNGHMQNSQFSCCKHSYVFQSSMVTARSG